MRGARPALLALALAASVASCAPPVLGVRSLPAPGPVALEPPARPGPALAQVPRAAALGEAPVVASGAETEAEDVTAWALSRARVLETRRVSGRVTDAAGIPLEDVGVTAVVARPEGMLVPVPSTRTNELGRYALDLPAGTYRLLFYPASGERYGARWWPAARDLASAHDVAVAGRDVRGLDVTLPAGHVVTGVVALEGETLSDVWVHAYAVGGGLVASALTDREGRYALRLAEGDYRLVFVPDPSEDAEPVWWGDVLSVRGPLGGIGMELVRR